MCVWDDSDPCVMFPTLYFDLVVDCFFLVCPPARSERGGGSRDAARLISARARSVPGIEIFPQWLGCARTEGFICRRPSRCVRKRSTSTRSESDHPPLTV